MKKKIDSTKLSASDEAPKNFISSNIPVSGMCFLPEAEVNDTVEIGGTFGNLEMRCWDRDKEIRVLMDCVENETVLDTYINEKDARELVQWLVSQLGALEGKKHFR